MTVSSTTSSQTFACNGATVIFDAPFRVLEASSVRVYRITIATGAVLELSSGIDYAVSRVGEPNVRVITTVAYSADYQLRVKRITDRLQETDYRDNDPFPAESHENALDRLTMIAQEDIAALDRTIRVPDSGEALSELPNSAGRASKLLGFDSLGQLAVVAPDAQSASALALALASDSVPTEGAGMVGWDYSEAYAAGTVGNKLRERVSVKDFGAVGDGVADDTAALAAARAYVAANATRVELVFPSGIYLYSDSPNWAIANASVVPEGEVRLRYTGTGNAVIFDGGASGYVYNTTFGGPGRQFFIEATASAQNGVWLRSVHHSKIAVNVRGCGAAYAGLATLFAVCNDFWLSVTINQAAFYTGARPGYGAYLTRRDVGERTVANTFHTPIIEGAGIAGFYLQEADMNLFLGGTSEGNPGTGVTIADGANYYNTFLKLDMESNIGTDVIDGGIATQWEGVLSDSTFTINAAARNTFLSGGQFNAIVDNGNGTKLHGIEFGSAGGAITGTQSQQSRLSVYQQSVGILEDKAPYALHASVSVPTATATTAITLPTTGTRNYIVTACINGTANAAAYNAYALIAADTNTFLILHQVDGSNLTITLSGGQVRVTQTSGLTQTVVCRATPL